MKRSQESRRVEPSVGLWRGLSRCLRWVALGGLGLGLASGPALAEDADRLHGEIRAAQAAADPVRTAALLDRLRAEHGAYFDANGFDFLAGVVAAEIGDDEAAGIAFERVIEGAEPNADRAAVRLARLRERTDPKAALSLLKGFTARYPGSAVTDEARLLEIVVRDRLGHPKTVASLCRQLPRRLRRTADFRLFALSREGVGTAQPRDRALGLLRARTSDRAAYEAAVYVFATGIDGLGSNDRWQLAEALYVHRRFGAAMAVLEQVVDRDRARRDEAWFLLGRAAMKAGDDDRARRAFEVVAGGGGGLAERALYQLGRIALTCHDETTALAAFDELATTGNRKLRYAAEAQLKLVRMHAGAGRLNDALRTLEELDRERGPNSTWSVTSAVAVAGAALVADQPLVALEVLSGRSSRDALEQRELAYWRGVALAAGGQTAAAVGSLRSAVVGGDLIARLARQRLGELGEAARADIVPLLAEAAGALAAGRTLQARDLAQTALDLGAFGGDQVAATQTLCRAWMEQPAVRFAKELQLAPARSSRAVRPRAGGHRLAADDLRFLGLHAEAADELSQVPGAGADPQQAYTIAVLAAMGGELRQTVLYGEKLRHRLPRGFPTACLPDEVFELLYPRPYEALLARAAGAFGVDPDLLRSVMREESRFDPAAVSPAGARGLMQFIPETAARFGNALGLDLVSRPEVIHEPFVAIPLGAAYLKELLGVFAGREGPAVAAYNAGEDIANEWLERANRGELDAFLGSIEYSETRTYVDRVLSTLAAYRSR